MKRLFDVEHRLALIAMNKYSLPIIVDLSAAICNFGNPFIFIYQSYQWRKGASDYIV
jgi:hypothetical protein